MRYLLNTEMGTFGIWDEHALDFITDKDTHMTSLASEKDMVRTMNEHSVVLWGTGGDGHRPVEVYINPADHLDASQAKYIEMESPEYKLAVKSGTVLIGSPEWAGNIQDQGLENERDGIKAINLENGLYKVKIYFLAWDYDDTSLDDMPEYVVIIQKADASHSFSPATSLETLG